MDSTCHVSDCSTNGVALDYVGDINTANGETCYPWSGTSYSSLSYYPADTSMEDVANNCRNPDQDPSGPWCSLLATYTYFGYTYYYLDWGYCDIPLCDDSFCKCTVPWC